MCVRLCTRCVHSQFQRVTGGSEPLEMGTGRCPTRAVLALSWMLLGWWCTPVNPTLRWQRKADLCESEAILVYKTSPRSARTTQWDLVSKEKKKKCFSIICTAVTGKKEIRCFCCCKFSGKGRRLKQAKEEAVAETDQYRLQMEKEFRLKQSKVSKPPALTSGAWIRGSCMEGLRQKTRTICWDSADTV